jgi:branched-chain amino acid transport system permease protein
LRPRGIIPEGLIPRRRIPLGDYGTAESVAARLESATTGRRSVSSMAEKPVTIGALPASEPPSIGTGTAVLTATSLSPQVDLDVVPEREIVLRAENLHKSFGGVKAVNGLSFELQRGAITALVGPNGAGKTTVFNLLTGAIRLDSGSVWLDGEDVTGMRPDVLARRGLVRSFQDVKLFGDLSVYENVMLGVQNHPGETGTGLFFRAGQSRVFERQARERALEWLSFVGMAGDANRPAGALGYGQQKLVAVARVLASEARVLLLDEPASGIDHSWVDVTLDLISEIRSTGRTICVVEHNLHVVGQLADHVYFMELGRVTAEGGLAELTSDPRLAEAYFGTD